MEILEGSILAQPAVAPTHPASTTRVGSLQSCNVLGTRFTVYVAIEFSPRVTFGWWCGTGVVDPAILRKLTVDELLTWERRSVPVVPCLVLT